MRWKILFLAAPLGLLACGSEGANSNYDEQTLQAFLTAIPTTERLTTSVPSSLDQANALTPEGDAELARAAIEAAGSVNAPAMIMVRLLREIVELPPTLFDSEERRFLWGPWPNDQGVGNVFVYIEEAPPEADFKYHYAFARAIDNDVSTAKPVIWGGATPDPANPDRGVGVTLWDFEVNNAFDQEHDPNYDASSPRDRGRFVSLYGHGDGADGEYAFNVAVFRDFISKDAGPEATAADLDFFYGRFNANAGFSVDFLDWAFSGDLCDAAADSCFDDNVQADLNEDFMFRVAFLNQGPGRAEATLSGGDLAEVVDAMECWDDMHNRTAFELSTDAGALVQEGSCSAPFDQPLDSLGLPTLADIDQETMTDLVCVAENGLEPCQ